jgi:Uma2 family endonuclease
VLATGLSACPDVSVVCGTLELDPDGANAAVNPVVLVEVLSDGTEAYDRGQKLAHYRRIPSLREYVLVSQVERRIELYRRNELQRRELYEARSGESLELAPIGCSIAVDEIYANPLEA